MTTDFFKRLALMLTLAVVQVLVLNRVHIFNIATPWSISCCRCILS